MAGFRTVLGAVDNAIRHGGATEVEVVLSFSRRRLHVLVCDRGEGFDVAAAEARLGRARGWGLVGMRARVENAGGTFEIRSAPGAGTEVRSVFDLSGS
jgi:signal transduction histidine kinase